MSAARALAAALAAGLLLVAPATADVAGPDDSIAQAYGPIVAGTSYAGSFTSETDVDYLAFDVARAGQALHFDVANTLGRCASPDLTGCPVYATLLDAQGRQLGGEGSSAGTGAVTVDAPGDVIDWTFAAPGRYYVALDSGGEMPTYSLRFRDVSAPPATPVSGPAILSLRVTAGAHGTSVRARLDVGRALRGLTVRLERAGASATAHAIASRRLGPVAAGRRTVTLRLDAAARRMLTRRGRLAVQVRVKAAPLAGPSQTVRRALLLVA